jgi:outer membrane receptor protein involved in Fe transport
MKKSTLNAFVSLTAIAALATTAPAFAQDAADTENGLDEIVVTASGGDKTQLNSSVSVTSVDASAIETFKPSSESEVFRLIPGIQVSGTAGPGGNANIAVRGLPVATGGAPFIQLQEDGLPVVLFGDIQFGNNDYWVKFDSSVANVEGVRGGSASTFASQAPGAVINYISHTGKEEGGAIQLSKGLDYNENRVDFRYGGPISDSLRFHVGGYFKNGRGPLHSGYTVSNSLQVKANVTKEFDEGKGYFRMLFRVADTQEPNYTGAPFTATVTGNKVSNIRPFANFDGRSQSNYSIYNQNFLIINRDGALERAKMDGITTKALTIGNQFHYEFSDAITVDNNVRWTDMSGGFASPFLNVSRTSNILGSTVNGQVVTAIRYASGPRAGQLYTDRYIDDNVNVRTNIRDIGSFTNDFAVTGKHEAGIGKLTARAGWFFMNQKIAQDWHVNRSTRELSGDNPSQLDLFAGATQLTVAGISGYGNNWGDCCARDVDLSYSDNAPYLALDLDNDNFALDGSVRFDRIKASGTAVNNSVFRDTNGDGIPENLGSGPTRTIVVADGTTNVTLPFITASGTVEQFSYKRNYMSWSAGALFKATDNLSLFARASRGGRFNADRQTLSNKFTNAGVLNSVGRTPSVDFVNQYEIGVKNRGGLAGGRYTMELTLLKGNFDQSTFEPTVTPQCPTGGCVIDAKYKSTGAEFYGTVQNGGFTFVANATYSKSRRANSGSTVFRRAENIPNLSYTLSANYDIAEIARIGLNATGQTSTLGGDGLIYPGATTFGGNLSVSPVKNLELGLQVYNLFNTLDLRGAGERTDATVTPNVIKGNAALGRTLTASVKYKF